MKAFLLSIGDEILIGHITDTNSPWISRQLNLLGIQVVGSSVLGDSAQSIRDGLDLALSKADLVVTTGGLGPTKDDITKKVMADYFDSKMVFDQTTYDHVSGYFHKLNRQVPEAMRDQCTVPEKATLLTNQVGTAPGMWFSEAGKIVVSMPGVPHEMRHLMETQVVPRLSEDTRLRPIAHASLKTCGIGETSIAERIKDFEDALPPHVKLAYLPGIGEVQMRVSAYWQGPIVQEAWDILRAEAEGFRAELHTLLKDVTYGMDSITLPQAVANILIERNLTIGTAESCTGGLVAHRLTSLAGASAWYPGSVVAYSYELKTKLLGVSPDLLQQHGAVSEECARAMAEGLIAQIGCDIAVAITGIAGPTGGLPNKPVGTVWMAVADKNRTVARRFLFGHDREKNIERSSTAALDMVRRFLIGADKE